MLREPFMVRAYVEVLVLSLLGGVVGTHVVLRRNAFVAEALHHTVFPGVALAFVVGASVVGGALAAALASVLILTLLTRRGVDSDAALAVIIAGFFAIGVVIVSRSRTYREDIGGLLFGRALTVTFGDIVVTMAIAAVALAVLAVGHRPLVMRAFDPLASEVAGYRPWMLDLALNTLVALVVVASVRAIGTVFALAFLVTPAAAARTVTRRVGPTMAVACAVAALGGIGGLVVSYLGSVNQGWRLAPGATMALSISVLFCVFAAIGARIHAKPVR